MLEAIQQIEKAQAASEAEIDTRIVEVPVFYQDPWTHETLMRFRDRHQDPDGTDLSYAARINGYDSVEAFIDAHSGSPWFVTMVGFVSGLPFMFQMVERDKQIQVPKYVRPRTDTPKLTVATAAVSPVSIPCAAQGVTRCLVLPPFLSMTRHRKPPT